MGGGGLNGLSLQNVEFLESSELAMLDERDVEEIYTTLKHTYEVKLKEIQVRKLEKALIRKLSESAGKELRKSSSATTFRKVDGADKLEPLPNFKLKKEDSNVESGSKRELSRQMTVRTMQNILLQKLATEEPTLELKVPQKVHKPVNEKALALLGDTKLDQMSREAVPHNAIVNKKVIQVLGEEKIMPDRLRKRLGSGMNVKQVKAQSKYESLNAKKKMEEQARKDAAIAEIEAATKEDDHFY